MKTPRSALPAGLAALVAVVAACGSSTPTQSRATATTAGPAGATAKGTPPRGHGRVAVLYAGSLVDLMEHHVGPAFHRSTGYTLEGFAGGSEALAEQVKGKIRRGDVFISAGPQPDRALEGRANGGWVSWYAAFATSALLLAYNPHSRFASLFRTRPWWQVVAQPGFRLGRTDPKLDPKGALVVQALDRAAAVHHEPALARLARAGAGIFPEEDLVGRLDAGQLDAGFFYSIEATSARPHLPTVSISPIHLGAAYTITVLRGAPDPAGAVAFVRYLLSSTESTALAAAGLHEMTPAVSGRRSDVPAALRDRLAPGP